MLLAVSILVWRCWVLLSLIREVALLISSCLFDRIVVDALLAFPTRLAVRKAAALLLHDCLEVGRQGVGIAYQDPRPLRLAYLELFQGVREGCHAC